MEWLIILGAFVVLVMLVASYAASRYDYWKQRDFEENQKSAKN